MPFRWPNTCQDVVLATREVAQRRPKCPANYEEIRRVLSPVFSNLMNKVWSTRKRLVLSLFCDRNFGNPHARFSCFKGFLKALFWGSAVNGNTWFLRWFGSSCWSINVNFTCLENPQGNMASCSPFSTAINMERWVFSQAATPSGYNLSINL